MGAVEVALGLVQLAVLLFGLLAASPEPVALNEVQVPAQALSACYEEVQ